jgi:hypothetical protein
MTVEAVPRGPRGRLLLGSGPELARDQLGFYAACAREHGDVVPLRLGPNRGLLVYHPDAIITGIWALIEIVTVTVDAQGHAMS